MFFVFLFLNNFTHTSVKIEMIVFCLFVEHFYCLWFNFIASWKNNLLHLYIAIALKTFIACGKMTWLTIKSIKKNCLWFVCCVFVFVLWFCMIYVNKIHYSFRNSEMWSILKLYWYQSLYCNWLLKCNQYKLQSWRERKYLLVSWKPKK